MELDERPSAARSWTALSGLTPLLVFSNSFAIGLALGISFLVIHTTASAVALLTPVRLGRARVFFFSALAASISASVSASILRLVDPFLFETAFQRIFIAALTLPVIRACVMPESMIERERGVQNMVQGLGYALAVIVMGVTRELLAAGSVSVEAKLATQPLLPIASQPAGAFFLIGLAAAGFKTAVSYARGQQK